MRIRVWAEYFKPEEFLRKDVIDLLAKYDVTVGMAFPPGSMTKENERVIGTYEQAGVKICLWPLLEDHLGYWPSERSVIQFGDLLNRICDWTDKKKIGFDGMAFDMEPPINQMNAVRKGTLKEKFEGLKNAFVENRERSRFYDASSKYNLLIEQMHARDLEVIAAAPELVIAELGQGGIGIQDLLETPITTVNFDVISFMIYTSMLSGYSHGLVSRDDATWHLYSTMRTARETLWDRAGVSIGVTYIGKLEDEPYYETPEELLPDFQAVKAALVTDVSIFNLEGIVRSPQPEAWFETLLSAEAKKPSRSIKMDAAHEVVKTVARFL